MAVASYYAVWASCTWCLAYELSMVFCWLLRKRWEIPAEVFPIVLLLVGTAGVIVCRYTVAIWIPENKRFMIGPRQPDLSAWFCWLCRVSVLWFVKQCVNNRSGGLQGGSGSVFCRCRYCVWLYCICRMSYLKRVPCVRSGWFSDLLWRQQKEHYRIAKENIDIINRKCHDLKHQIAALRDMCTKEEREKYIEEIQDSIQIYEAMVKTGNDVLDTDPDREEPCMQGE